MMKQARTSAILALVSLLMIADYVSAERSYYRGRRSKLNEKTHPVSKNQNQRFGERKLDMHISQSTSKSKKGKKSSSKSHKSHSKKSGSGSHSDSDSDDDDPSGSYFTVYVIGTAEQQFVQLPHSDEHYSCFYGLHIFDAMGNKVGICNECFLEYTIPEYPDAYALYALTEFQFDDLGTILTKEEVTMQPVVVGNIGYTHITGAISDQNGVVMGDGSFENTHGFVRRNGQVALEIDANNSTFITFNEIYSLDIYKFNIVPNLDLNDDGSDHQ